MRGMSPGAVKATLLCLSGGACITGLLGVVHALLEDQLTAGLLTPLTIVRDLAPASLDAGGGWSAFPYLVLGSVVSMLLYAALIAVLLAARSRAPSRRS